ncbi:chemotaxis protein CheD [bacterium]|nr:chemotaxis protein CheD [bacterium]
MNRNVGIAEMQITTDADDILITYSLGSCVGLSLHDPIAGIGGLIHCMLPLSSKNLEKAKAKPYMFVDTGVTHLLQKLYNAGATRKNLIAYVAGGANIMDVKNMFRIGKRNYTVLRKILWKNNILIAAEDLGGNCPRTMKLEMKTGTTWIRSSGREFNLMGEQKKDIKSIMVEADRETAGGIVNVFTNTSG